MKDSKKTERKAIELLSKTKVFQDFIKKNGMLASLFGVAGNPNDPNYIPSLTGLQTRAQVNSIIQNQLAAGGPNTQQVFQQNIQQGQAQLQQLKDKINKLGTNSRDDFIPEDFRPNPVKGLSFFQRIHIGADFQTTKHNRFFPISSDIGLSLRYVLNSNSNISIGSSFKVGWGSGFDNISLSSQGISIRGGFDWRLRGNLFIAGNYEQNYFSEIRNIDQIRDHKSWKTSALLGLSKKYKAEKKRTGEIKLLYDFFYNRPPVRTQSIIFRFGYNF